MGVLGVLSRSMVTFAGDAEPGPPRRPAGVRGMGGTLVSAHRASPRAEDRRGVAQRQALRTSARDATRSVLDAFRLDGRTALVTGGGRGLGRAMAVALAEAGADVAVLARHRSELGATARHIRSLGRRSLVLVADVSSPAQVRRAFARLARAWRRLNILINNAGVWDGGPLIALTPERWRRVLDVNVGGVFLCAQQAARLMIRQHGGAIINISSVSGIQAHEEGAAYCASKAAVLHATRVMALEWGRRGIRVNAIGPGLFQTRMTQDVINDRRWIRKFTRRVPLGRYGQPEDLAGAVVFLASDASRHLTGQTLFVDGGSSIV